jgi:hypothetical protein
VRAKNRRNQASQTRTPAIKSSIAVLSPRFTFVEEMPSGWLSHGRAGSKEPPAAGEERSYSSRSAGFQPDSSHETRRFRPSGWIFFCPVDFPDLWTPFRLGCAQLFQARVRHRAAIEIEPLQVPPAGDLLQPRLADRLSVQAAMTSGGRFDGSPNFRPRKFANKSCCQLAKHGNMASRVGTTTVLA